MKVFSCKAEVKGLNFEAEEQKWQISQRAEDEEENGASHNSHSLACGRFES